MAKKAKTTKRAAKSGAEVENLVQLATRVPAKLHQAVKLHCVKSGVSVMDFVRRQLERGLK